MSAAVKATLLVIAVVLIGMAGSFIWFVATWDKEAEQPIGFAPASTITITEDRTA
ncbi:hypothetical protein [Marivita sp. XM-24bin2]|jgi:hypothetical protein|uniref:hypothetical protein n=1 Tax=unclassified Marivita TaxID=2632480 RepID=UPI0025C54D24|nr:hypothetical protein [Marivita sp. XM-24bin2]MCR9109607.1 hypothetical protein [Paracoccaceae bacterium]